MARKTLDERKKPVNIRIDPTDLVSLKAMAQESGLGYQTLMASILHRFIAGNLVDRGIIDEMRVTFSRMMQKSPLLNKSQPPAKKKKGNARRSFR